VRKLALAVALALATPSAAYALGLGDVKLHSALNQPLHAEIDLVSVRPGELEALRVGLASAGAFTRAGLDRPGWLSQFDFSIENDAGSRPHIKVTTREPIREPFVSFLVEANWASGRLVREYTLLLDPPIFAEERSAAQLQAPVAGAPRTAPAWTPPARTTPARTTPAQTPTAPPESYVIRPNDTLFSIARKLRPSNEISLEQVMLALARANPEPFEDGNINHMKAGYTLRLPDRAEFNVLSPAEATQEVRRQNAAWQKLQDGVSTADQAVAEVPDAEAPLAEDATPEPTAEPSLAEGTPAPQLKLLAPAPEEESAGEAEHPAGEPVPSTPQIEELQRELALAHEGGEAQRRENEELRARVGDLEGQIDRIQRLLTLKDEELARLQGQLGTGEEQSPGQVVRTDVRSSGEEVPGFLESILADLRANPTVPLGAAGASLLAVLAWFMVRRRRRAEEWAEEEEDEAFHATAVPATPVAVSAGQGAAPTGVSPVAHVVSTAGVAAAVAPPVAPAGPLDESLQPEAEDIDPLAEAEVYLAYGRHQQARELIDQALSRQPERHDLRLKMLEVHAASKDSPAFAAQLEELHGRVGTETDPLWMAASELARRFLPDHPLLGDGGPAAAAELADGDADLLQWTEPTLPSEAPVPGFADPLAAGGESVATGGADELDLSAGGWPGGQRAAEVPTKDPDHQPPLDVGAFAPEPGAGLAGDGQEPAQDNTIEFDLDFLKEEPQQPPAAEPANSPEGRWLGGRELELPDLQELTASMLPDLEAFEEPNAAEGGLDMSDWELGGDEFELADEAGTKLDLAKAYIDMGDDEGARSLLAEVLKDGNEEQKREADGLLQQIPTQET
jgi:pilus assembly protein FimV